MRVRGKSYERRDKTSEEYEYERASKECTFKPRILVHSQSSRNISNNNIYQSYSTAQMREMFTSTSTKSIKGYKANTERIRKNSNIKSSNKHVMTVSGNSGTYKNTFSNYPHSIEKKRKQQP
jgi:hypothetical protein